jgi:hypothetical protein
MQCVRLGDFVMFYIHKMLIMKIRQIIIESNKVKNISLNQRILLIHFSLPRRKYLKTNSISLDIIGTLISMKKLSTHM